MIPMRVVRALFGSRFGWSFAALLALACVATAAVAIVLANRAATAGPPEPLTAYVPQGSLLAIESPEFASLLSAWTSSAEEQAWLKSDNYAEFSHSRLFARLGEAQSEFATTAGLAPDAKFLARVAGGESVFAWYDIGKLEFLYITRMKPGEAAENPLLKLAQTPRGGFQMRRVGADSFYLKAKTAQAVGQTQGPSDDRSSGQSEQRESVEQGNPRTVAIAVHGDLLLLATREDLIANALLLAQHQGESTLRNEPWYAAAVSAVVEGKDAARPDMRMTLNLARIVPSPYFRSYWVQRNVTWMKQYQSAVSDLYRTSGSIREERVLIPKSPDVAMADGELGPVLRYLPADSGVYRATAHPGTAAVLDELNRRLIAREAAPYRDLRIAPVADLSDRSAGTSGDLDTRIDEQPVPELPLTAAVGPLCRVIEGAGVESMLVYTSAKGAAADEGTGVFLPVHSAVVLRAAGPWDEIAVQSAFADAIAPRLTVAAIGLAWQPRQEDGESWVQLRGLQALAAAVRGDTLIVASDPPTLLEVLRAGESAPAVSSDGERRIARNVAGFSHTAERDRFLRLTGLLDHIGAGPSNPGAGQTPAFFSKDMGGLSGSFKALDSETFVESTTSAHTLRQTVVYRWRP
jgi:hypothetical protein